MGVIEVETLWVLLVKGSEIILSACSIPTTKRKQFYCLECRLTGLFVKSMFCPLGSRVVV
jgi:hypothetical protein